MIVIVKLGANDIKRQGFKGAGKSIEIDLSNFEADGKISFSEVGDTLGRTIEEFYYQNCHTNEEHQDACSPDVDLCAGCRCARANV